jgi:hypothetical protein
MGLQKFGPLVGAAVGLLPQCGFAILAAMLFLQNNISLGTMIAVFIATSDEAIPVLLADPGMLKTLGILLFLKFVLAIAVGYLTDFIFPSKIQPFEEADEEDDEEWEEDAQQAQSACPCCYVQYPIWKSALLRTLKIFLIIFGAAFVFTALVEGVGEETLSHFLLTDSWLQPLAAALFGFIPNCAATVILCELYALGQLSFASLAAGLITNAGLGLAVLIQYKAGWKTVLKTALILFVSAAAVGLILMSF